MQYGMLVKFNTINAVCMNNFEVDYKTYLSLLFQRIPEYIFEGALSIFVIGIVIAFSFLKVRKGLRVIVNLLLIEYLFLIYCSTVIFRDTKDASLYKPISFDIYKDLFVGDVAPETFFNVLFFVLIGLLLWTAAKWMKWWHIILVGCSISISIEVLQYFFRRGTMELVDVFLNTLGCAIGIMIVAVIKGIWKFCSYLFVPQWGSKRSKMSDV